MVAAQAEDTFKKETFVLSVAQSPDGKWLASGSMDGTVAVFDATTGQLLHTLDGHFKPVRSLCFTPGSRLLSASPSAEQKPEMMTQQPDAAFCMMSSGSGSHLLSSAVLCCL